MQKVSPDGGAQRGTRVVPAWYPHGTRMVPGAKSVVPWVPNCNLTLLFVGYSKLASGGKFPFYNTKLKGSKQRLRSPRPPGLSVLEFY